MIKEKPYEGLEYIYSNGELISIILRSNFHKDEITFFTPDTLSQQLGYLPHKKGDIIQAHRHIYNKREVHYTQEVLFVKKGRVKVNLYDSRKKYVGSEIIQDGDFILLCGGAHGFEFLEDSILIEIKQGPYTGEQDKERFQGVEKSGEEKER
jgi:mannose-6-phosphate isomerase-like protein (cupin superfamily)